MIDTIKGYIEITNREYSDFEHLFVDASKKQKSNNSDYTISFNLSNFKITIKFDSNNNPKRLWFNGSLSKYYFGNNLAQLDLENTKKAIKELSDNINLDMREAIITRIDVGFSFVLKEPIHKYISCIQEYPRLGCLRYTDSVTFVSNKTSPLTFYDKQKEMKKSQKIAFNELNNKFSSKHIIRYEIRLYRHLNQKLGTKSITAKNLYSKAIQKKLFTIWRSMYYKTSKLTIETNPVYLLKKRNGTLLYLSFHGINFLGYDKIKSEINSLKFNVKNQSTKRSKMMIPIKKLSQEANSMKLENNLIHELDCKIELMKHLIN